MAFTLTPRERRWLVVGLAFVVGLRLATLGAYPLMDPTESRYAEIARKMLASGQWIMPQFDYGVPFWGKPPLSTWLSALSMAVFGVNEFAARLPSLFLLLLTGYLVYWLAGLRSGRDQALWSVTIFSVTGLVFIAAGAVMTDPALALGTTCSMAGFWVAVESRDGRHRLQASLLFFGGLAIGLLAKGPVAVILTGLPIGLWVMWTRRWRDTWARLPWIAGTLATALVVVPWYWMAERTSPGFLNYFLVGEHWKRFTVSGWQGDLYGAAHARPKGTIWLQWLVAALPWSVLILGWVARQAWRWRNKAASMQLDAWGLYLVLWSMAPMIFFTVSGNVLATYVLPGLPALALWVGGIWRPREADGGGFRAATGWLFALTVTMPALFVAVISVQHRSFEDDLSHKALVRAFEDRRASRTARLIYLQHRPISAEFYARGTTVRVASATSLEPYLRDDVPDFVAIRAQDLDSVPPSLRAQLVPAGEYGKYLLLYESRR
jgi:4-amino-4-deoxy-L-arabinose transferase-like glycosyltransferase